MKIVSIIEANTVNAVAKGAIEFIRTARELTSLTGETPLIECSFVTFDRRPDHKASPNEFVLATRASGIDIDVIPERRRFDLSVTPTLRTILEQRQPDLVITHSVKSHFLMWRSGLGKKYPWLAFHHGYTTTDRKMRIYNRLDRWSLPKADRVLTVCHAFAEELAKITDLPVKQILVQHNAIRPKPQPVREAVQALRQTLEITDGDLVILSVGRLSKEKAHADLIDAFNRLSETSNLRCTLVIVGDGPERGKLASIAQKSSHAWQIVFAGHVPDVQPFYALADVFVLPSHREGSPNALLEAMAADIPVVATGVGGVPEIVSTEESALLVPADNPTELAGAIARVLTDRELAQRLTINAARLIATQYAPEIYSRNLYAICREIVKRREDSVAG